MTTVKPFLMLNRLVVIADDGTPAYDEIFHLGVNIVRGQNSSGKSTIANFIFFALGADFHNWTKEAARCRTVFAELKLNDVVITTRRDVRDSGLQPMFIFWGSYLESANANQDQWQVYPYKETKDKIAFSNVLFNALGFPEVRSAEDNKVTMHQILRLLYVDQDTPHQNLFRFERFDVPLLRQATAEMLLGIYDDELYTARVSVRNLRKELDEKEREYKNLIKVLNASGTIVNNQQILNEIERLKAELEANSGEIEKVKQDNSLKARSNSLLNIEKLQDEIGPHKKALNELKEKISNAENEVDDSELFIKSLQKRLTALKKSIITKQALGEVHLDFCPHCMGKLTEEIVEGKCILCKNPLTIDRESTHSARMKQEVELQIKESQHLLNDKKSKFTQYKGALPSVQQSVRSKQRELDSALNQTQSTRDDKLDALLVNKGVLENQIEVCYTRAKSSEIIEALKKDIALLDWKIKSLELEITEREATQTAKKKASQHKVSDYAIEILRKDLPRQEEFQTGQVVNVDFLKDTFNLDGSNSFSASSNVYFKNSILFALFFTSLELSFTRYPKFILCDNVEDKGMEESRSQNFQKQIVEMASNFETDFQIILTTSMINPELNGSPYAVGEEYTKQSKTLKFKTSGTSTSNEQASTLG